MMKMQDMMKNTISMIFAALLVSGLWGCSDMASLDGLEDRTKEEGSAMGETEASKALEELLVYDNGLAYNWVTEYSPDGTVTYTILFGFNDDDSVSSDSPSSVNDEALGLFSVGENSSGNLQIRFDGAVMLSDEMIGEQYRETQLQVDSYDADAGTVACTGMNSGVKLTLSKADASDIQKLGAKVVWSAFSESGLMHGILRDGDGAFKARYALDRSSSSVELTWIENNGNEDAVHETISVTLANNDDNYTISWTPVDINGTSFSSLIYDIAGSTVSSDASGWTVGAGISAVPDFVDGASRQYYLGGHSQTGDAHPDLWPVLVSDNFRDLKFYPYADDIPVQVRAYISQTSYAMYLFVNDYYTSPSKSPRVDTDGDWITFYQSQQGDFLKLATGDASPTYTLDQMATDLKAFTDFYFHADGLYVVQDSDTEYYLISASGKLWVKVSSREQSDTGTVGPDDNLLETFIAKGMKPYGTFYENGTKNFKLHYDIDAVASTADLIWIESEDVYTEDGNYKDMAISKAQYKTVGVTASADGYISFDEPLVVGGVTYKGMTWTSGSPSPDVEGMDCTIRTPMSATGHPLEYFFTYPVNKYEGGNRGYMPYTKFCLPTSDDNIAGLTGTDRYIFYPYTQDDGLPAGPMSLEIFPVGNGQSVTVKSWRNGQESHVLTVPVNSYSVEDDRMIFTKGTASGELVDESGNVMTPQDAEELFAPLERLLFSEDGFHVYKAESVDYDLNGNTGRHYFYLISPDPDYPYWIKVREG